MKNISEKIEGKQKIKFVFIAHYIESWNWLLNWRFFSFLHKRPKLRWILFPLFPICWLMSYFYAFRKKPFNVVDHYTVNGELEGYTILITNFAWHFLFIDQYPRIRERILKATLYAQEELRVDVVGLGALTKAEWVTEGGLWLTKQDGVNIPIVHGDTCTALFVIERIEEIYNTCGFDKPIALIGPTSKIGRAIILALVERGYKIKAYTDSIKRIEAIQNELSSENRNNLIHIRDLAHASDCRIWITGKYEPRGKKLAKIIPSYAIVLNFAVPDPLTPYWLNKRKDIKHFDGGFVNLPNDCSMYFTMRLKFPMTYACNAGTMIHAFGKMVDDEVSDVVMENMERIRDISKEIGISISPPTSHLNQIY